MKLPELKIKVQRKNGDGQMYSVCNSSDACDFFRTIFNKDTIAWTEESAMICLNRKNEVIGYFRISSGGTYTTIMDVKVIFTQALISGAQSIIIAHNHPSGNTNPSEEDVSFTKRLIEGGKLLDIKVLDHIILTDKSYISMADNGCI